MRYAQQYEAANGADSRNAFAPYTYDAYLLLDAAVAKVPADVQPAPRPSGSCATPWKA